VSNKKACAQIKICHKKIILNMVVVSKVTVKPVHTYKR